MVTVMGGKGSGGRNAKPVEQKIRLGNVGKRRLPSTATITALPPLVGGAIPVAHRTLGTHGAALWQRVWTSGAAWLRPALDGDLILMACEMTDERSQLRAIVLSKGGAGRWRERRALRDIDRQITGILAQIGFSPTDRASLDRGSEVKPNEFSAMRRRVEAKRHAASG